MWIDPVYDLENLVVVDEEGRRIWSSGWIVGGCGDGDGAVRVTSDDLIILVGARVNAGNTLELFWHFLLDDEL